MQPAARVTCTCRNIELNGWMNLRSPLLTMVLLLLVVANTALAQGTGSKQCYFGVCSDGIPPPSPTPPTRQDGGCLVSDSA